MVILVHILLIKWECWLKINFGGLVSVSFYWDQKWFQVKSIISSSLQFLSIVNFSRDLAERISAVLDGSVERISVALYDLVGSRAY